MIFNGNNCIIDSEFLFVLKNNIVILVMGIVFSTPVYSFFNKKFEKGILNWVVSLIYIAGFILSAAYIVSSSYNPFLYFRF